MRKAQVISGKGAHPLHPPPRSVPAFGISVPLRGGLWIFSLHITLTKGRLQREKRVLKFCRQSNLVIKNTNSNLRVSPFRVLIAYWFSKQFYWFLWPLFLQNKDGLCYTSLSFFVGIECWEREMIHVQLKVVSDFNRDVHMRKLDRDGRN